MGGRGNVMEKNVFLGSYVPSVRVGSQDTLAVPELQPPHPTDYFALEHLKVDDQH